MKVNNSRLYHGLTILALTLLASTISGMEHAHGQMKTLIDLRKAWNQKKTEIDGLLFGLRKARNQNMAEVLLCIGRPIVGVLAEADFGTKRIEEMLETKRIEERLDMLFMQIGRLEAEIEAKEKEMLPEVERRIARLETERQEKQQEMFQICLGGKIMNNRWSELPKEMKQLDEALKAAHDEQRIIRGVQIDPLGALFGLGNNSNRRSPDSLLEDVGRGVAHALFPFWAHLL